LTVPILGECWSSILVAANLPAVIFSGHVALRQTEIGHELPVGSLRGSLRKSPKADSHCRQQSGSTCPQAGIQVISIGANPVERKADVQWFMANLILGWASTASYQSKIYRTTLVAPAPLGHPAGDLDPPR
jgi:hypothetical protein